MDWGRKLCMDPWLHVLLTQIWKEQGRPNHCDWAHLHLEGATSWHWLPQIAKRHGTEINGGVDMVSLTEKERDREMPPWKGKGWRQALHSFGKSKGVGGATDAISDDLLYVFFFVSFLPPAFLHLILISFSLIAHYFPLNSIQNLLQTGTLLIDIIIFGLWFTFLLHFVAPKTLRPWCDISFLLYPSGHAPSIFQKCWEEVCSYWIAIIFSA